MKTKDVTNEQLLKELKQLREIVEANKQITPYIVQPPVVIIKGHDNCTCHQCHPPKYYPWFSPPYIITCGPPNQLSGQSTLPAQAIC